MSGLVEYWKGLTKPDLHGRWVHPDDSAAFARGGNTFNVDYPPGPFIGDVVNAPVVILGLNGRYSAGTKQEFSKPGYAERYVARIHKPVGADWSDLATYYVRETNFGHLVASRRAVVVNGCTYRSPKWSEEPFNRAFAKNLPSCNFARRWLVEEVVPAAARGERLVVAWRWGSWNLGRGEFAGDHFIYNTAPVSPTLPSSIIARVESFLNSRSR